MSGESNLIAALMRHMKQAGRKIENASIGIGHGLANQMQGSYDLATNPAAQLELVDGIKSAAQNPRQALAAVLGQAQQAAQSPLNAGQFIGEMSNPRSLAKALAAPTMGMTATRKIPEQNFRRRLSGETESLYRETNAVGLSDMMQGSYPWGDPDWYFAEAADMALGQGKNKGLLVKVKTGELKGRPDFGKPGLEKAYLDGMGEFVVRASPAELRKHVEEVVVTPAAFEGLRKPEIARYERELRGLEQMGVKVIRADRLPGR